MSEQIIKIGNHELVHITEVRELRRQLAWHEEHARNQMIKLQVQGDKIHELETTLARKQNAGDLLFEELDDKTPKPRCNCIPHGLPCLDCDMHSRSRTALKAWKEANK